MKLKLTTIIIFFCGSISFGQNEISFDIQEIFLDDNSEIKKKTDFNTVDDIFYEDEKYIVTTSCSGEWGGSIFFENKDSRILYACSATCPVAINKIDGKYFVTNSLAHLGGGSDVIEIENPELMSIFKMPEPRKIKDGVKHYFLGDTESKSFEGARLIWSEYGVLVLTSFQIDKNLFHIITKNGNTFLATTENNELKILNKISEERLWDYDPRTFIDDNNIIVFFNNTKSSGFIEITGNQIKINRTK